MVTLAKSNFVAVWGFYFDHHFHLPPHLDLPQMFLPVLKPAKTALRLSIERSRITKDKKLTFIYDEIKWFLFLIILSAPSTEHMGLSCGFLMENETIDCTYKCRVVKYLQTK